MDNQEGAGVDMGGLSKRQPTSVTGRMSLDNHAKRGDLLMMLLFVSLCGWMQNHFRTISHSSFHPRQNSVLPVIICGTIITELIYLWLKKKTCTFRLCSV